jgi:hypothetical protein
MKDWVEIGVFAPAGRDRSQASGSTAKHLIKSGKQKITVTVPQKPTRAGIDPNHLLMDWKIEDNSEDVKQEKLALRKGLFRKTRFDRNC